MLCFGLFVFPPEGGASEQPAVMSPSREQQQQEEVPGQEEEEEEEGALDVVVVAAAAASPVKAASTVDCPICQRAFHSTEIVMHAAFCDGEQDVVECADDPSPGGQSHAFSGLTVT